MNLTFHFSGCTANQSSTVTLLATEDNRSLENGTFLLPFNSTCQWNITAPVGKVLSIDAGIFLFHKPCGDMYLKIHDGPSELSSLISEYCLNVTFSTKKFSSSGRSVWIEAKKGPLDSFGAFLISYQAIPFEGKRIRYYRNENDFKFVVTLMQSS